MDAETREKRLKDEIEVYLAQHFIADTVVKTDMATLKKMAKHFADFGTKLATIKTVREDIIDDRPFSDALSQIDRDEEEHEIFMDCGIW